MKGINLEIFKRVTSGGKFIYQIDSIRFFAIFPVLLFHLNGYFNVKYSFNLFGENLILNRLVVHGSNGVELFFILSGFILLLPFVNETRERVDVPHLKRYYLRRITRLEPPYIIAMSFFSLLLLFRGGDFEMISRSYLSSLFYLHNIIFEKPSIINVVVWSLEVELQFYLLAPILALLFLIRNKALRRIILLSLIFMGAILAYYSPTHIQSFIGFFHFFITGMLLADIYSNEGFGSLSLKIANFPIWLVCLFIMFWFGYKDSIFISISYPLILMLFFILTFQPGLIKTTMNSKLIYLIGGMCYSIYLLHYPLISFITPLVMGFLNLENRISVTFGFVIVIIIILLIASIFFVLIEKPAMYKDWYKVSLRANMQRLFS